MSPDTARKTSHKSQLLMVLAAFFVVAAGGAVVVYSVSDWNAPEKIKNMPNPTPANEGNVAAGMSTYRQRCAKCHGDNGDGKGEKAGELSIAPTNFTNASEMKGATDGELFWKISVGHRPMPSYKSKLTEEERWQLVDYIRTFAAAPRAP
jgi:mono/diheme cytochrome c family protein